MKRLKKVFAIVLAVVTLFTFLVIPANAAYVSTGKSFKQKEGGFLGVGSTQYTYKIYKDGTLYAALFHSLDVCTAIYHTKNKGTTSLTYSKSRTYSSQTAYSFSASLGFGAGKKLVNGTVGATGGKSKTTSYSVSASGTVGRTIPTSAPTGYYKMTICHNFYKYQLKKYKTSNSAYQSCTYLAIPTGSAYVSVLYGTSTDTSSYRQY